MANKDYNFQYTPLTGRLPGNSFVKQTEQAINELAGIVNEGSAQVEVITNLANQANDNSEVALERANEALETASRVYITLPNLDDADDYFDSQLYYFANSNSANLPVQDTGFLEVKTNDTKTAAEQVFIADTTGLMYMRHGVITSSEVGSETVYSVAWETWSSALASEDYVQQEVNNGVDTANDYTDEQIRQHGNLPVGYEYFTFNPSIPQGSLPLFGGEYSRDTYNDLWAWVQTQTGYLKTEAEWQTLSASNNGNVPYYSSGDGSTTFRVPSLKCWVRGANGTVSEVGSYLAAGLPNITGVAGRSTVVGTDALVSGAFYHGKNTATGVTANLNNAGANMFDASRSNPIYGNSTTVQPESIVGLWLVKAYGVIVDTGQIDEQQYIDDRFNASKQYTDDKIAPIGTVVQANNTETISVTATATNVCSVVLTKGVWVISGTLRYLSMVNGRLFVGIIENGESFTTATESCMCAINSSAVNTPFVLSTTRIIDVSEPITVYLCGYADATVSANIAFIKAVRII